MRPRLARRFAALLILGAMACPARAWNIPAPQAENPQNAEEQKHAQITTTGLYHTSPHGYFIEHAARVLREEGKTNWAACLMQYHQDLVDGSRWPDRSGVRQVIHLQLWWAPYTWVTDEPVKTWVFDLCDTGSLEHYYNPKTGKGLTLAY